MKVGGPGQIVKNVGEQALEQATRSSPLNLFADDTMSGRRANVPGRVSGSGSGERPTMRQSMEDLLAKMGATDSKKQAFDVASDAVSNVVKGGFKGASDALSGISGAGDALGGISKAIGSIMGIVQQLMPIIGAVMSFF
jgi:hypothetical protein